LALLCLSIAHAQTNNNIKPLSIGDTLPAGLVLTNVLNSPVSEIRLSDLKGKLVILDFWATWCSACLEVFPKIETLQKEFAGSLQTLLINPFVRDDTVRVKKAFEKLHPRISMPQNVPVAIQQAVFQKYFPFRFVPHYVWINQEGRIIATTSKDEVTAANIRKALKGDISFHLKNDNLDFNPWKPLFTAGTLNPDSLIGRRSTITPYIEGAGYWMVLQDYAPGKLRYCIINYPALTLFTEAFDLAEVPVNRLVFDSNVQDLFTITDAETDKYNKAYCYEVMGVNGLPSAKRRMRIDLEDYFGITVQQQSRLIPVKHIMAAGNKEYQSPPDGTSFNVVLRRLNDLSELPFTMDKTLEGIFIRLPADFYDMSLQEIERFLFGKGLQVVERRETLDVFVFSRGENIVHNYKP